jgi:uncharacterized protein
MKQVNNGRGKYNKLLSILNLTLIIFSYKIYYQDNNHDKKILFKENYMKYKLILILFIILNSINIYSQEIPNEYKNEVLKYFELTNSADLSKQILNQMLDTFKKSLKQVPEEIWDDLKNEFENSSQDILENLIPIYYKYYTIDDIKKLNEFYDSEIGKKIIKYQSQITKESYDIGVEWGKEIGNRILKNLKDKGYLKT